MATASMARKKTPNGKDLYDVHPGVTMLQNWVTELKEKTGRSLEEWLALIKKEGPKDEMGRREWLKTKHKLGTNSAWWLAERAAGQGGEEEFGRIPALGGAECGRAVWRREKAPASGV